MQTLYTVQINLNQARLFFFFFHQIAQMSLFLMANPILSGSEGMYLFNTENPLET